MMRDICRDKTRDKRDKWRSAHVPIPGQTGHHPFRDVPDVPVEGACPGAAHQLALFDAPRPIQSAAVTARQHEPVSRPADRARAYAAWLDADRPWPPPAGLLSACISACLPRHQPRKFR